MRASIALRLLCVAAGLPMAVGNAQSRVVVQVVGSVFDSLSMTRLPEALVRLVKANDPAVGISAIADSSGGFLFDSVPGGVWLATFFHPVLDSLLLEPAVLQVDLNVSGVFRLELTIPSARKVAATTCGLNAQNEDGLLAGTVRSTADESNLVGASVVVSWPEWIMRGRSMSKVVQFRTARTDSVGKYFLCGVPNGAIVRARASLRTDSTGELDVPVRSEGYTIMRFLLAVSAADGPSSRDVAAHVGRARIQGQVNTPEGQPVADAIVRVLESGSPVRSSNDGSFIIHDAMAGSQMIEARKLGYSPHRFAIDLHDATLTRVMFTLPKQHVQLDTVRVAAGREVPLQVRAIERRARSGTGNMLSGDLVRERSTLWISDALRGMNGVIVTSGARGSEVQMRDLQGNLCSPFIYIDGVVTKIEGNAPNSITIDDFVSRSDVAAVEVYPRANLVPPEFNGGITGCGAIAVWSRFATGNIRILPQKSDRSRVP